MKSDSAGQVQETNGAINFGWAASSTYYWDSVTIKINQNVPVANLPIVTQIIGQTNNVWQFAVVAMLIGHQIGNE